MQTSPWLTCRIPQPNAPVRLVCFPCAGGGTAPYFAWPDAFSGVAEVHAVQMPGRERRRGEPLLTSFDAVQTALVPAIESISDRPLAFFGHSMGALMAFEVARSLRARGRGNVSRLFVAARDAPGQTNPPLHQLPDEQLVALLDARYGGIPDAIRSDPDLLQFFLPIIRADLAVLASHVWSEELPLNCSVTVMGGRQDLSTSEPALANWQRHTTGRFELKMYDGDHFFPTSQRDEVTRDIRAALASLT